MKLLRDTWLIFARCVVNMLRTPVWIVVGLFQPVCYLILFAPLLDNVASAPGFPPGGALKVFTPGVVIMLAMYGAAFVGFGLIAELRAGVIERFRVTPVSRLALLLGRALRDVLILLVQAIVLILVAIPMGLRASVGGVALTLGLLVLIGLVMSSCSYAIALAVKDEDALAPLLNFVMLPLLLLSGITLPLSLAPRWIQRAADANPMAYAVDAARALFNGRFGDASVVEGFAILAVLALLAIWWAARAFRQATA